MASLAQLLVHHGSILLLDAASTQVQVGLLRSGRPPVWRNGGSEAGTEIFRLTAAVLADAGCALADVAAFAFCSGPGSMLGVRTVAMTLRTWQSVQPRPAYAYLSLTLLAHEIARTTTARPCAVIADARRDTWHAVTIDTDGQIGALTRAPQAELAAQGHILFQPASFRAWATAPRSSLDIAYAVESLLAQHADADLFSPAPAPDAFQHEAPEYKKWSAQVHSAASVPPR